MRKVRGQQQDACFYCFLLYFLRHDLSLNLELTILDSLAGQQAARLCVLPTLDFMRQHVKKREGGKEGESKKEVDQH